MKEILERFDTVPASALIIVVMFICFVLGWLVSNWKEVKELWDNWYKKRKRRDELLQMLLDDHERLKQCEQHITQYADNRVSDREQSFQKQKEITDAINKINDKLDKNTEQLREIKEDSDKKAVAEMRDSIMRAFRYYDAQCEWNRAEKETFDALIEVYESRGGNGTIKSNIIPKKELWKLVD